MCNILVPVRGFSVAAHEPSAVVFEHAMYSESKERGIYKTRPLFDVRYSLFFSRASRRRSDDLSSPSFNVSTCSYLLGTIPWVFNKELM